MKRIHYEKIDSTQKEVVDKKWPNSKYIAYFQARTNTYAPLEVLKEKYCSQRKLIKLKNNLYFSISLIHYSNIYCFLSKNR